jgi:TolB protein
MAAGLAAAALTACGGGGDISSSLEAVFSARTAGKLEIFAVDTAGARIRRLSDVDGSDSAPAWSSNRQQIAFLSDRDGVPAVWLMDAVGQSERRAFPNELGQVTRFFWAPDSRRISYEVVRAGAAEVVIGDVSSGKKSTLVQGLGQVQLGGWSPDGVWVLYTVLDGPEQGVHRKNPAGVDSVRLTMDRDLNPRWSGDGKRVAFNRRAGDGSLWLVTADRDGRNEKVVYQRPRSDPEFDWSPDGKRLAFVSDGDGNPEVYVATADGKRVTRLTSNQAAERWPRWSRDGRTILFLSDSDGDFDMYTMQPDGSSQTRVADTDEDEQEPDW